MKRNFFVIYKHSILNKIKSKSFLVFAIVMFLISLASSIVPAYIETSKEEVVVGVVTNNDNSFQTFESVSKSLYPDVKFEETNDTSKFDKETFDFVIDIDEYTIYSYEGSLEIEDQNMVDVLFSSFNTVLTANELNLNSEDLNELLEAPESKYVNLGEKKGEVDYGSTSYIFNYVYTVVGMLILTIGSQFIGQEILEEKTTRAMEIIMTSVTAGAHLFAKILSNLTYIAIIIIQAVVFSILGDKLAVMLFPDVSSTTLQTAVDGIKDMIANSNESTSIYILAIIMFLLLVISLLILFTMVATIASSVTTTEEFQNANSIITVITIAGYIASLMITNIDLRVILSYIPIVNFYMLPGVLLSGNISAGMAGVSVIISIVFYIMLYMVAKKVYRVGVLNYSANGIIKVFKQSLGFKIK
ncbi:MAG: ABC transporter permease [Bacilli bacterium]